MHRKTIEAETNPREISSGVIPERDAGADTGTGAPEQLRKEKAAEITRYREKSEKAGTLSICCVYSSELNSERTPKPRENIEKNKRSLSEA